MKFAAYDNEYVIWGIGDTEEEAATDARHWLELNHENPAAMQETLTVDPCTEDLAVAVQNRGGQIPWEWSGTLQRFMQLVSA